MVRTMVLWVKALATQPDGYTGHRTGTETFQVSSPPEFRVWGREMETRGPPLGRRKIHPGQAQTLPPREFPDVKEEG